jgi:hypothetical protein
VLDHRLGGRTWRQALTGLMVLFSYTFDGCFNDLRFPFLTKLCLEAQHCYCFNRKAEHVTLSDPSRLSLAITNTYLYITNNTPHSKSDKEDLQQYEVHGLVGSVSR